MTPQDKEAVLTLCQEQREIAVEALGYGFQAFRWLLDHTGHPRDMCEKLATKCVGFVFAAPIFMLREGIDVLNRDPSVVGVFGGKNPLVGVEFLAEQAVKVYLREADLHGDAQRDTEFIELCMKKVREVTKPASAQGE